MWNYRVIKTTNEVTKEESLEIREVYYNGLGKPMGHCPAIIGGSTLVELKSVIDIISEALNKPPIKVTDFKS